MEARDIGGLLNIEGAYVDPLRVVGIFPARETKCRVKLTDGTSIETDMPAAEMALRWRKAEDDHPLIAEINLLRRCVDNLRNRGGL